MDSPNRNGQGLPPPRIIGQPSPSGPLDFERARSRTVDDVTVTGETQTSATAMSISDAAMATGLTAHTLRYYERVELLDPVAKNQSGRRRFSAMD